MGRNRRGQKLQLRRAAVATQSNTKLGHNCLICSYASAVLNLGSASQTLSGPLLRKAAQLHFAIKLQCSWHYGHSEGSWHGRSQSFVFLQPASGKQEPWQWWQVAADLGATVSANSEASRRIVIMVVRPHMTRPHAAAKRKAG